MDICLAIDSIKARKRRRAQIRRQAYERSLVDQVAPDNDDLYARKKQATDDPLQPTATDECASLVVDSLDSPHQGQDAAALIGKTSNEGLFEETDNDTSNRPDQRSRALEDAISSLSEKLERILPAGSRPSVIRAELTSRAQGASSLSTTIQEAQLSQTASDNGDLVLSQTQHSQQSVSLWDDIQEIFHALLSKVPELERQVRGLTATPSRLLLDAIQNAARLHARAVVDGILLPLTEQNESTLTKVHTELIFNVLKSQAPTTLVHFLGEWLTSLTNPGTQKDRHEQQQQYDVALQRYLPTRLQSLLMHRSSSFSSTGSHSRTAPGDLHSSFSIPTCLSSDIQISLLQSIISLPVLSKSPLPSRLWHQLNENLEVLWTAINTLISRGSQPLLDSSKAQLAWVKALYLPNLSIPLKTPVSEGMRLSNAKLPPILVLWIMRHGPSCQDTAILQQLQQFCEAKLDVKSGKPILAKIEALLKKKAK
ncbi:hypothetical protein BGW41_004350 [Actinomortierella wolfii]|nr:hypothetical protein BGW41_004350 [Actinomortierella wolfii]